MTVSVTFLRETLYDECSAGVTDRFISVATLVMDQLPGIDERIYVNGSTYTVKSRHWSISTNGAMTQVNIYLNYWMGN